MTTAKKTTAKKTAVKQPQDHKPKAEAAKPDDARTVTLHGRDWTVPLDALDDFELLDDLNALDQHQDATRLPAALRRLLGDQWRDAIEVLRDKDTGRVSIEAGSTFFADLMGALNPNS